MTIYQSFAKILITSVGAIAAFISSIFLFAMVVALPPILMSSSHEVPAVSFLMSLPLSESIGGFLALIFYSYIGLIVFAIGAYLTGAQGKSPIREACINNLEKLLVKWFQPVKKVDGEWLPKQKRLK